MPRIRVFHWKAAEAGPLIEQVRSAGYVVEFSEDRAEYRTVRANPPDVFVIDLTRLPSQGREVAVALRGSKSTRHVPIVFVDGEPEKVAATRRVIPDAVYTRRSKLAASLKSAIAKPPVKPFVPTQMMDRFANRSVAQKLGITKPMKVGVVDAPSDYLKSLSNAPEGVEFEDCASDSAMPAADLILWFLHDTGALRESLRDIRGAALHSRVWLLWRKGKKRSPDQLDGAVIRQTILAVGLVDYKICSFSGMWSAIAIARKKIAVGDA